MKNVFADYEADRKVWLRENARKEHLMKRVDWFIIGCALVALLLVMNCGGEPTVQTVYVVAANGTVFHFRNCGYIAHKDRLEIYIKRSGWPEVAAFATGQWVRVWAEVLPDTFKVAPR